MTDLSYDCLERMDQLIHQSVRGIHLLFDRADIVKAITQEDLNSIEENSLEKLKQIQELLYKFIQLKSVEEKKSYLESLSQEDYLILIRAYFKIVDNSILNKLEERH